MHPTRLAPLALAISAAFIAMPSRGTAQTTEADSSAVLAAELPAVTIKAGRREGYAPSSATSATKMDTPLRDVPQSVNVVPQQVIRDQAAHSMQDVLRNVPGVAMSSGDGQRDQVTIRGFTAIADQFIDGLRDDALYFRDLSNIERVEVLKGPAAVLYGRGSSGGLINRVTKKPEAARFGEISLTAGSHDLKRLDFDANTEASNAVALRVTGAYEDSGSFRDQGFTKRSSISPAVALKLGAQTKLLVQGEYARDRRVTDFGTPSYNGRPVDVAPGTYYGSGNARRDDYTDTEVSAATVTLDHRFSEALSLRNVTRYYRYALDRNNTLPGGTVDSATLTVGRSRGTVARQDDGYFNQTDVSLRGALGGIDHVWLFGLEVGRQNKHQNFISQSNIDRVSIFNPGSVTPPPMSPATLAAANPADSVFDTTALYLQDQLTFAPAWKALLGLRHDAFEQSTTFRRQGAPLSREDRNWSPRAGLVWQPSTSASYYLSFSRSYQPSGEAFALAANNAENGPEKTENREIGAKLDFLDGTLSLTGSLFELERSDIKTSDPATPGRLINVGRQRTRGAELTLGGRLPQGWDLLLGYAYLDGRITQSNATQTAPQTPATQIQLLGKRSSLTPRHSGSLWAIKALGGGFSAGGGLNFSSSRYASPSNAVMLPGYVTADLAAYYRTHSHAVALNLKNVTNKRYIASAHGSNDNLLLPGAPRSAELTLTWKF